ncbi:MAG: very short patch repair endonuclease, partial [Chloroflexi bacterium]|nr:very short patch repair endonuclease [Chloroflexota bacterium]
IVQQALHRMGAHDVEREGYIFPRSRVHLITGDFVFRRAHAVVYADGARWHQNLPSLARLALCRTAQPCIHRFAMWHRVNAERGTRDEHYDNYLRYRGWHILRLRESDILHYERARRPRSAPS